MSLVKTTTTHEFEYQKGAYSTFVATTSDDLSVGVSVQCLGEDSYAEIALDYTELGDLITGLTELRDKVWPQKAEEDVEPEAERTPAFRKAMLLAETGRPTYLVVHEDGSGKALPHTQELNEIFYVRCTKALFDFAVDGRTY